MGFHKCPWCGEWPWVGSATADEPPPPEEIDHPAHYAEGRKYEPKDVIRDWGLNFFLGNTVKYISRAGRKGTESTLKDLRKARWYLDDEITALEADDGNQE